MTAETWQKEASEEDFRAYVESVVERGNGNAFQEEEVRETAEQAIREHGYSTRSETGLLALFAGYSVCGTSSKGWQETVEILTQSLNIESLDDVRQLIEEKGTEPFDRLIEVRRSTNASHRPLKHKSATDPLPSLATNLIYDGEQIESLTDYFDKLQDETERREQQLRKAGVSADSAKNWAATKTFARALTLVRNDRSPGGVDQYNRVGAFDWLELVVRVGGYNWLAPHMALPEFLDTSGPDKAFRAIYSYDVHDPKGVETLRDLTRFGKEEAGMTETGAVFDLETCLCVYEIRLQQGDFWWRG